MGVSENRGTLFWGPSNKDPTIWGTMLGSPIFGNSHDSHMPRSLVAVFLIPQARMLEPLGFQDTRKVAVVWEKNLGSC